MNYTKYEKMCIEDNCEAFTAIEAQERGHNLEDMVKIHDFYYVRKEIEDVLGDDEE
jgi:hypothetical protein